MQNEECWALETSTDGTRWRRFGKAWRAPSEPVLMHAVPRFVRFRRLLPDEQTAWSEPLEMRRDLP
ncbi:MAG: hypothetical protein ACR2L4_04835 [Actinomycetota bacterium]